MFHSDVMDFKVTVGDWMEQFGCIVLKAGNCRRDAATNCNNNNNRNTKEKKMKLK